MKRVLHIIYWVHTGFLTIIYTVKIQRYSKIHCAVWFMYCVEMAAKPVCVLFYLLLAGGVVSGFTPVTYPARVSSECGQYDLLQDQQLMETLGQVQQQLDCIHSKNRSCQKVRQKRYSCSSRPALPATTLMTCSKRRTFQLVHSKFDTCDNGWLGAT